MKKIQTVPGGRGGELTPFEPGQRRGVGLPVCLTRAPGYLTFVALNEPRAYLGFLARLLPLQINARLDGQVADGRQLTLEEAREELCRRGLPDTS